MINVNELLQKLTKYYWGPKHPKDYVFPLKTIIGCVSRPGEPDLPIYVDEPTGLGKYMGSNYAAFNLTYAYMRGVIETPEQHSEAVVFYSKCSEMVKMVCIEDAPLEDYLTTLSEFEFACWYADKRTLFSIEVQNLLDILTQFKCTKTT